MLNRTEVGIAVTATVVPLAVIGALTFTGHRVPADPPPPITVQPAPVYVPAPAPAPAVPGAKEV